MPSHHDTLSVSQIGNRARGPSKADLDNNHGVAADEAHMYSVTQWFLKTMKADSQFFQNNPAPSLPHFNEGEVSLEKNLGQGEFGVVCSIGAIHFVGNEGTEHAPPSLTSESRENTSATETTHEEAKTSEESFRHDQYSQSIHPEPLHLHCGDLSKTKSLPPLGSRQHFSTLLFESDVSKEYMSEHVFRDGQTRYAVKQLRKDLNGDKLVNAMVDLAAEANFLMSLRHPNICKMRGSIGEPGKRDFAIVLDRLTMTLLEKMQEWKEEESNASVSLISKMKHTLLRDKSLKQEQLYVQKEIHGEKLMAVYDVARALRHLAKNRIIFRDLKPENVGVDVRGNLSLFDFGLAKELKDKDMKSAGMYKLTGMTGSRRYMAPEVVQSKDYGLSADVYSFAILAWEVFSNRKAYSYLTPENHFETVVKRKLRPPIKKMIANKKVLPEASQIHTLVNLCWSHQPLDRPRMEKVCEVLFAEALHSDGVDGSSNLAVDRSKHLAMSSLHSRVGTPLWC